MRLTVIPALVAVIVSSALAFCPPRPNGILATTTTRTSSRIPQSQLYFFGRNKKDDEKEQDESDDEEESKEQSNKPFFARMMNLAKPAPETKPPAADTDKAETKPVQEEKPVAKDESPAPVVKKPEPKKDLSAAEQAVYLKAQAERMRLEAERMDAQLTLDKIDRLELQLAQARKKGDSVEELLTEMEALQAKMRGEAPKAIVVPKPAAPAEKESITVSTYTPPMTTTTPEPDEPFNEERFQEQLENYKSAPDPLKGLMAGTVGLYSPNVKDLNATEVALRMEMLERSDYSFLKEVPPPKFTQEEIKQVEKNPLFNVAKLSNKDQAEDKIALKILKDQYYTNIMSNQLDEAMQEAPFFEIELQNITELDQMTVSLFPQACRKEGQTPTLAQATTLVMDVLPKAGFNPSGKPEPVEGGYLVRGTNKLDSADALIESIDACMARSSIRDSLSVFFIKDYTVFTEEQIESPTFSPADSDPILLVTGPNVYREPRRLLYSAISAAGIGTSWYLSIYPFLLNPDLMKRAEEQMSLADANMAYDLTWLTDLSLPLFLTFMGVQLAHELGHRAAAAAYGVSFQ